MTSGSPKHIGIMFPSRKNGGVFQFALSIAENLARYSKPGEFDYTVIHYEGESPADALSASGGAIKFTSIPEKKISPVRKVLHFLRLLLFRSARLACNTQETLGGTRLDLIIYPTPFTYDFFTGIPSVAFIPNVMHKYYPNLPEFPFMTRVTRDIVYRHYAREALLYASDSRQGIEDIAKFLGAPIEKARAIPFIPPGYIYSHKDMSGSRADELAKKLNLPDKFYFYPAQFWPHKNHMRLMRALALAWNEHKEKITVVLSGSAKGIFAAYAETVFEEIKKLGLEEQIVRLGYVSDEEMAAVYKKSYALLNPSLLGPTGIPFVEAIVLGVPVLAANIWEIPNVVGPAGRFFDPLDEKDIATKMLELWKNPELRNTLIEGAKQMAKELTPESYAKKWLAVIGEALGKSGK